MIDSWVWDHYHRLRSQLSCLRNFLCVLQQSSSEENLIKGKSKKISNTKRKILRNKVAQFLLHLTATLSKVMELCPLRQFIKLKHLPLCILGMSLIMPRLKPPLFQRTPASKSETKDGDAASEGEDKAAIPFPTECVPKSLPMTHPTEVTHATNNKHVKIHTKQIYITLNKWLQSRHG